MESISVKQKRQAQTVDYSKKWLVLITVGMGIFLATIDGSIVNVALPTLVRDLSTNFSTVQWVVLGYLLTVTTLMLTVGRAADMIGKKPIYTAGFIIFTIGSVLCGLSPTIYALIGFRILQAIGAAMIMALGLAIVTEAFPPSERGKALGISGSIVSIGIVIGPTLGGLLIDAFTWHWIFFVNLPIGILGTILVLVYVPNYRPGGKQKFDYLGALTLFISLLSLLVALTFGQQNGFTDWRTLVLIGSWVIFLCLFITIELRSDQPMIDLRLFRNRLFTVSLITGFSTFVTIAGTIILMPFYLENVLGFDTRQVGLLLAIVPIGVGVMAPISGSLSDRFGPRVITITGLIVLLIGYTALSSLSAETTIPGYLLRFIPIGIGMGIFQSPNNSAIMGTAPRERLGIVSGMLAITRSLGQTVGIAVLGALWAARVIQHSNQPLPGGVTQATQAVQVAGLQDTFKLITLIIAFGLFLGLWGLIQFRRESSRRQTTQIDQ